MLRAVLTRFTGQPEDRQLSQRLSLHSQVQRSKRKAPLSLGATAQGTKVAVGREAARKGETNGRRSQVGQLMQMT